MEDAAIGITIRHDPHPDGNPLHWTQRSSCPHLTHEPLLVVSRREVLVGNRAALAISHQVVSGCACPLVAFFVEGEEL